MAVKKQRMVNIRSDQTSLYFEVVPDELLVRGGKLPDRLHYEDLGEIALMFTHALTEMNRLQNEIKIEREAEQSLKVKTA